MKTNLKKEATRWGLIVLLGIILVSFTQCVETKSTSSDPHESSDTVSLPGEGLLPTEEDEESPEVGVKDAERIFHTMSVLTGVPATNTNVRDIFNSDYKAQLPYNSRVEAMLESHILGATKLASEFCQVLIDSGTFRVVIWPAADFNFGANSNTAFQPGSVSRGKFIVLMLERFWGQNVLTNEEYEAGYAAIDQLISESLAGLSGSTGLTLAVAKTACTAALASPQVLLQ